MRLPFEALFERRGVTLQGGYKSISDMLGREPVASGVEVTPDRAVTVPSVYACVNVLAEDVAKTPIKVRRRSGEDTFTDATDHPLWEVLHALANPETTAFSLKHAMMFDLLLHERAYAEIVRVDGRVTALWRLDPTRMEVSRDPTRRKRYRYTNDRGEPFTWLFDVSRPPILELSHPSPLRYCRDLIGIALALQRFTGRFFANGARLSGVLQTKSEMSPEAILNLQGSFDRNHRGSDNAHKTPVLEEGVEYKQIAAANDESQLNETLQTVRNEICGVFRIPPFKISDLSRANYSNVEALSIEYVTGTLDPWFTIWEHAIRRDLLTTRQYGQFDITFDRSALIRSDVKNQHDALARGIQSGFYSPNDARRKLGENPIPTTQGGDTYMVNAAMTPIAEAGEPGRAPGAAPGAAGRE